jgi:hypothetical protein
MIRDFQRLDLGDGTNVLLWSSGALMERHFCDAKVSYDFFDVIVLFCVALLVIFACLLGAQLYRVFVLIDQDDVLYPPCCSLAFCLIGANQQ